MADCNSIMRLMPAEKGAETPTERYKRMKDDISQWYKEMDEWGLSQEEQKSLEPYYLPVYASPAQQEDMMVLVMKFCGFSLSDANYCRKVCAKKKMDEIPKLHKMVVEGAANENFGNYLYETAIKPQLGYSFSKIHSLAYSYIGLQTVYLATYFPPVYWNTACLRVDAGLDEDSGSDYAKLARAVGNMVNNGITISAIDINKSGYLFEPDEKNNRILFGLKALNGIGADAIPEIVNNRPYMSFEDFQEKAKVNMPTMFALIKSGAFDCFEDRTEVMRQYVTQVSKPKSRITMQNFKALSENGLLPRSLKFQRQVFNFDKTMKATCKIRKDTYALDKSDVHYRFFCKYFDADALSVEGNHICLDAKVWKKMYDEAMEDARDYVKKNGGRLLEKLNESLFQEKWDKYASGGLAAWEMDAMGFYCHPHELAALDYNIYGIRKYSDLPYVPEANYTFKRGGKDIAIPKTCRIAGTVVGKNNTKAQVDILTRDSGVVTVKFSLDYFAQYNRRITDTVKGVSKVVDEGWFQKGSLIVINGYRSADIFRAKSYKRSNSHQLYKITRVNEDGTIEMTNKRYGDSDE